MTDTTQIDPGYETPAVLDLVQYVQTGQPLEFEKTFNQLIQARISQLVDDKRLEIADQFFDGVDKEAMSAEDDLPPEDPDDLEFGDEDEDEDEDEFIDPDDEEEEDEEDGEDA